MTFYVTGDADADRLLADDPLALMIGMLLDQQVPMEWAFMGPFRLRERLDGELDAKRIAGMNDDEIEAVFKQKPALHRFPGSMGKRCRDLCAHLVEHYDGDAAKVWETADDGEDLLGRLTELPGYGEEKARIFLAVLGKRLGVAPDGWEEAAVPFSDDQPRSVADIGSEESLQEVRAFKKRNQGKA